MAKINWNRYTPDLDEKCKKAAYELNDAAERHGANSPEYQKALEKERGIVTKVNKYLLGETNEKPRFD